MTVTSKLLVSGRYIENTVAVQYTSTGCKSILDKPTVLNVSVSPITVSFHLVPAGGVPDLTNKVAADVSLAAGATYLCPEIAGARLDVGDALWAVASAASAASLRVDGRQLTTA